MGAGPGAREDLLLVRRAMFRHEQSGGGGEEEVQPSTRHKQTLFI